MVRKVDETGSIPKVWEDKVETAEHKPVVHDTEIGTAGADSKRGELQFIGSLVKSSLFGDRALDEEKQSIDPSTKRTERYLQEEAKSLIAAHTQHWGISLDEDGLGRRLAALAEKRPDLVREVFRLVGTSDGAQIARVMLGLLLDDQLRNLRWNDEGVKLLNELNKTLVNNSLTSDGRGHAEEDRIFRERIGRALLQGDDVTFIVIAPQVVEGEQVPIKLTADTLLKISPVLGDKAEQIAADLNVAVRDAQIKTRIGQAMFIAQVLHEIGERGDLNEKGGKVIYNGRTYDYFFYMYDKESPNPRRRKVALDLGNTELGDGARFHGRGYIQLTGRQNYRAAGEYLGIDLENNPDLAADPSIAARVAGWFWRYGNGDCNSLTKEDTEANFRRVTMRINGGLNGYEERKALYKLAKEALGINGSR